MEMKRFLACFNAIVLAGLIASALCLSWGIMHAEKLPGTISGYVYKSQNSNGLMGEKIKIYKGSALYQTATTEKNGKYRVDVPKGTYAIMAKDKNNGIDFYQVVTVKPQETVRCRDVIGTR